MLEKVLKESLLVATAIVTIYGLIDIILKAYSATGSIITTAILIIFFFIVIIAPWILYFTRRGIFKEFGMGQYLSKFICLENTKETTIGLNLRANTVVRKKLVFMKVPHPKGLVDWYTLSPRISVNDFPYNSPDAVEVDRKRESPDRLAIFWSPKVPIVPHTEYIHEDRWSPDCDYDESVGFSGYYCDVETGVFKTIIRTPFKIVKAVAFRRPKWPIRPSDPMMIRLALEPKGSGCPRPFIDSSGKQLVWEIVNPKVGENYMCLFFTEEGLKYWEEVLDIR